MCREVFQSTIYILLYMIHIHTLTIYSFLFIFIENVESDDESD